MFAGFMPAVAASREAALERRRFLDESVDLRQRVQYLGAMIGLPLSYDQIDKPLTARRLAEAEPSPHDRRSFRALEVAREGWSLRDVLAHGVIDYHPVVGGPAADIADHMQQWFEAGACDGFSLAIDGYHDGVDAFVDEVVPLLQGRGLFHLDYEGPTVTMAPCRMYHSVDIARARATGGSAASRPGSAPRSTSLAWAMIASSFRCTHGPTSTTADTRSSGTANISRPGRSRTSRPNSRTADSGCVAR